ncbi:T9SS type A sorting domain-containing protein [Litoribacter ruber]|uniref:T9SS type A sorting domain-containing protein n=1 Tax=Litoribacter ruber TaxID=702568 RepID=A0AAP2CHA7_9BACT|nr:T9SS type A sorting domain-containing protein [Litoribacter alkaliphilus]MBT0811299.1 T9SS type A sorting domain-containing protein [Litoribacter ruber]
MVKIYILNLLLIFTLSSNLTASSSGDSFLPDKVYPNPASDYIYFQTDSVDRKFEFEIYSLIGNKQNYFIQIPEKGLYRFEIVQLQPGPYFLSVTDRETQEKQTFRFHKNN